MQRLFYEIPVDVATKQPIVLSCTFYCGQYKNYVCNTPDAFLGCWFLYDFGGLKGSINSSFEEA